MTTKELYDIAENHQIQVECLNLPQTVSFCLRTEKYCYIAIDPLALKTEAQERERMAHELGHCETGSFYNRHTPLDVKGQHEERAARWAIRALVDEAELERAVKSGIRERWELAEYFNLPEPFIEKALAFYKMQRENEQNGA